MLPTAHGHDDQRKPERVMQDDTRETTQDEENPVNKPQSIPLTAEKPQDIPSTESTESTCRWLLFSWEESEVLLKLWSDAGLVENEARHHC